jgi:uncharacterized protein
VKTEAVLFHSKDELRLEGELDLPRKPRGTVLICHAHPRMQGTMRSPLLLALRDDALERRLAVLRFNFRGVGESDGEFGEGVHEVADAAGALAFARERLGDLPVGLAGWSFGGAVAVRLASKNRDVAACAAIAPSVKARPGISVGLPATVAREMPTPLLVVCGSNDDIVLPEDCRELAEEAPNGRYEEIKAANHFFWAKYDALTSTVGSFLEEVLTKRS